MNPDRVLHVFKYFRPDFTGEGIFLERLAPVFQRLRPDVVHEVAVTTTGRPQNFAPPPGLAAVHFLSEGGPVGQTKLVGWLACHATRFSTVHYHTHVDRSFAASALLRIFRRRVVLSATLDDSIPGLVGTYRPLFRPLVRVLSRMISMFVAISPRLFVENNQVAPRAKSVLVPIGITIPPAPSQETRAAARRKLQIPQSATVFLSVGGICARKDQLFLIEQMASLVRRHPDLVLVLVGPVLEPEYRARLEAEITHGQLGSHVMFAGYQENPWDYYDAADAMVFASREEGFGTVVIEAMARGLPVLVRRLPGVNDTFVEQGSSGFLFDDTGGFQAGASALASDAALRRTMGERGRAFVADHYDIDEVAARYLAIYGHPTDAVAA